MVKTDEKCGLSSQRYNHPVIIVASLPSLRFAVLLSVAMCCFARLPNSSAAQSVQQPMHDGDQAFARGNYQTALQSFEKAWQFAQALPADAPVRYDILKRLSESSVACGQFAEADRYLQLALAWRESSGDLHNPKFLDDLLLSINLDVRMKKFDRALATGERVRAVHTAAFTADSLAVADDDLRIGQIYLAEKQPQQAVRALQSADALRTKLAGPLDPGLLPILDGINEGFRAIVGGTGTGTESLYRQALMIRETLYGEESGELIPTIEWLAETYEAGDQYLAAEPFYERLLGLWGKLAGKDHPTMAITLDKLAALYAKEGETEKAREASARSVVIRTRFLALGLLHQAADALDASHAAQARQLCTRALAAVGPATPENRDLIEQIERTLGKAQNATAK